MRATSWRGLGSSALFRAAALLLAAALAPPLAVALEKGELPIPAATLAEMAARDTDAAAPILIRAYKKESEIEIWKKTKAGAFVFLKSFPICRWSGMLGPKKAQGDRQTPEGFYAVGPTQMNPNSHYFLSFDTGYPNAFDRAHGGSGSAVMLHGTCSSAGCFAMTDKGVAEIYALAREALRGGPSAFQFQSYPFKMTAQNMARYRFDENIGFWRQLKEGSDRFEATGEELAVSVVDGRYAFAPSADPARETLAAERRRREQARIAAFIAEGSAAVRTSYSDGGQNPYFTALLRKGAQLGEVSRPEALAYAGIDQVIAPARGLCARKGRCPDAVANGPAQARPLAAAAALPPPKIVLAVARTIPLPPTEPLTLAPTPLSYQLGRPAPQQVVIAGAMPILPPVMFD